MEQPLCVVQILRAVPVPWVQESPQLQPGQGEWFWGAHGTDGCIHPFRQLNKINNKLICICCRGLLAVQGRCMASPGFIGCIMS